MVEPWIAAVIMFVSLIIFLFVGVPVSFVLGGLAVFLGLWIWGPSGLFIIASTAFGELTSFILLAVPLFVLMANALGESGIAKDLFNLAFKWFGGLRGGLGVATIVVAAILAAMVGVNTASTAVMALIAIPTLMEKGYDKKLSAGAVGAGGALGVLIPPSALMIILGVMADLSVGQLFAGGIMPGIVLSVIFTIYILVDCHLHPSHGPGVPEAERATWKEKFVLLRGLIFPILIIVGVLGSIYGGIATPTEAAGIGAFLSFIAVAAAKKLTFRVTKNILLSTLRTTCMVLWITVGAVAFTHILQASGVNAWLLEVVKGLEISPWVIYAVMQVILLFLGCFIDPIGIIYITSPIFFPIIVAVGFDPTWYAICFIISMQLAYITPPFGFNLFVIRGVAPEISMGDLYRGIAPFTICQAIGLVIFSAFPNFTMWLPRMLAG